MLTVVQQWAEDHSAKINYDKSFVITFDETAVGKIYPHHCRGHQLGSTSSFPIPARKKHTRSPRSQVPQDHHRRQPPHESPLHRYSQKIKMGTAKVIGYQKTFRRSGDFGYQQHITSVIWKALVLSHSTVTRKHVPPQNTAADRPRSSSAQRLTSKMHGHNRRHLGSRNAERRLRDPTGLTDRHSRTSNPAHPPHHGGKKA